MMNAFVLRAATRTRCLPGLAALVFALVWASARADGVLPFSESELRSILKFGPWPQAWSRDPSNRVSGKFDAVALGERLFFDERLSVNGRVSCGTCHVPELGWTDGRARGVGLTQVDRNTPSLLNVRLRRWFGWDGAADSLWSQSMRPIVDARELGSSAAHVAKLVRGDAALACRWENAFGAPPPADDEKLLVDAGKALAAFQETLDSGRSGFDDFRDALARGDLTAASNYSLAAQRGLKMFIGRGACANCHFGPDFSNGEFADVGIPFFIAPGRVDAGRHEGIRKLAESRYNLLSAWNDDRGQSTATGTRHVAQDQRNFGEFKVPSLRNAAMSPPYMHNGSVASLKDVVRHYSELNVERLHADGTQILKPLKLAKEEATDLLVFLESLTNFSPQWRPLPDEVGRPCVKGK
jgi:cytochrome c peroxidase